MTSRADVRISVFATDDETWKALSQVFEVKSGEETTWINLTDAATGVAVTFFKSHDPDHFEGNLAANIAGGFEPEVVA